MGATLVSRYFCTALVVIAECLGGRESPDLSRAGVFVEFEIEPPLD